LAISKSRSPCISKKYLGTPIYLISQKPITSCTSFQRSSCFHFTTKKNSILFGTPRYLISNRFITLFTLFQRFLFPQLLRFKKHLSFMIYLIPLFTSALRGTANCSECHLISMSNLNLLGLFSTERGKRDLENEIIDWEMRLKKWHSKCNRLYLISE